MILRKLLQRLRPLRPRRGAGALAWAVLLIGLIFSAGLALNLRQVAVEDGRERADEAIARGRAALDGELDRQYGFLRAVAALPAGGRATQEAFARHVDSLVAGRVNPGTRGVVYIEASGARLEVSRVAPPEALRRLAPLAGLDETRRAVAEAREGQRPTLSPDALFLPVYRAGELDGWLGAALAPGLLERVLRASNRGSDVSLELVDGVERPGGGDVRERRFELYGRPLALRARTTTGVAGSHYGREALLVMVLGFLLSALLFALVIVLSRSNARALRLANDTVARMLDLEERFRHLAATPVGIFRTDGQGTLTFGNRRWQELTGGPLRQSAGSPWTQIVHPQDRRVVEAAWSAARRERSEFGRQFKLARADEEIWVACRMAPLAGGRDARAGWVGSLEDVTALRRQENELTRRALHDPLTGLPNRSYFMDRLGQAIERSRRARTRVAVLFLDLDGFKAVNDSVGHDGGDRVLVEVAHRLKGAVRGGDTVARFGGDEFTVLCEDVDGADEMAAAAGRISDALAAAFEVEGREFPIDCSIGIAIGFGARAAPRQLLRTADVAMYEAKSEGAPFRLVEDGRPGVRLA